MNDRRTFIKNCTCAIGIKLASTGSALCAIDGTPKKTENVAHASAANWMSQWMLSPQHGEKKLRGPGQGMLVLGRFADPMYIVEGPVSWTPDAAQSGLSAFTVPNGFVTDLASIPPIFWSVLRPDGEYAYAAILHDYLYWVQHWPREQADNTLRACMVDFQVDKLKMDAIYEAVHRFGEAAWKRNAALKAKGESRFLKQLPTSPKIRWTSWRQDPSHFYPNPTL